MALSKKLVERFQSLHLEKFGKEIDISTAEFELSELAELLRLTSKDRGKP